MTTTKTTEAHTTTYARRAAAYAKLNAKASTTAERVEAMRRLGITTWKA